jgi:hypothetical protein
MNEQAKLTIGFTATLAGFFFLGLAIGKHTRSFSRESLIERGIIEHNQQTGKLQWKESK